MKITVLGGYGFVGKSVMEELQNRGYSPVALSRRNGFDLLDYETASDKLKEIQPDIIINCAAHGGSLHYITEFAADVVHDNMQMALNIYRMVTDVCPAARVINPMANCAYPGTSNVYREAELWDGPVHDSVLSYGNTRRMVYVVSRCYQTQHTIFSVNLLVPNCYGPGDYTDPNKTHALNGMVIRILQANKEQQKDFEIWGTGKPTREWIHVKDFARMLCNAIDFEEAMIYPVNIAQNKAYSIRESAETIKEMVGYKGKLVFNTSYQDGAPIKIMDDTLFRKKFPEFRFTDMREGIDETIRYYKSILEV